MKKKTILKLSSAILVLAILTVGAVASSSKRTEKKDLYYNGITIMIDGAEYVAKDANGNVVEPFIMDGTTYLPVRGVANAFDKEVQWNPESYTITIGYQDYKYLKNMNCILHEPENCRRYEFSLVKDGVRLYQSGKGKQTIAYDLNGEYSKFVATLYSDEGNGDGARLKIYGDDKELLYTTPIMDNNSPELDIEIDVSGHSILYLETENNDEYEGSIIFKDGRVLK